MGVRDKPVSVEICSTLRRLFKRATVRWIVLSYALFEIG